MVEFTRRNPEPEELAKFRREHENAGPRDFDSMEFREIKRLVKRKRSQDQFGLCAYCECRLKDDEGQIDHVKPKAGKNGRPELTFVYENLVHSCCRNSNHCGQSKGGKLLPIEPGPVDCNDSFMLSTTGNIEPREDLSRREAHFASATRDILGLNHAALRVERERWVKGCVDALRSSRSFEDFIADEPFRFILRRLRPGRSMPASDP